MSDIQKNTTEISESRRNLVLGATAVAAGLGITTSVEAAMDHKHMHHEISPTRQKLIDSSLQCVKDGQACIQHCIDMFKMKDTSMAE